MPPLACFCTSKTSKQAHARTGSYLQQCKLTRRILSSCCNSLFIATISRTLSRDNVVLNSLSSSSSAPAIILLGCLRRCDGGRDRLPRLLLFFLRDGLGVSPNRNSVTELPSLDATLGCRFTLGSDAICAMLRFTVTCKGCLSLKEF